MKGSRRASSFRLSLLLPAAFVALALSGCKLAESPGGVSQDTVVGEPTPVAETYTDEHGDPVTVIVREEGDAGETSVAVEPEDVEPAAESTGSLEPGEARAGAEPETDGAVTTDGPTAVAPVVASGHDAEASDSDSGPVAGRASEAAARDDSGVEVAAIAESPDVVSATDASHASSAEGASVGETAAGVSSDPVDTAAPAVHAEASRETLPRMSPEEIAKLVGAVTEPPPARVGPTADVSASDVSATEGTAAAASAVEGATDVIDNPGEAVRAAPAVEAPRVAAPVASKTAVGKSAADAADERIGERAAAAPAERRDDTATDGTTVDSVTAAVSHAASNAAPNTDSGPVASVSKTASESNAAAAVDAAANTAAAVDATARGAVADVAGSLPAGAASEAASTATQAAAIEPPAASAPDEPAASPVEDAAETTDDGLTGFQIAVIGGALALVAAIVVYLVKFAKVP